VPKIKVAGIQLNCSEEKKKNIEKAVTLVEMAAERGANIICLQELFNTLWFPKEINSTHYGLAEKADGETVSTMRELAKRKGAVIIAPFFEEGIEGVFYNSAAVIESDGSLKGFYRKIHIPRIPLYEESYYFSAGDLGFPVFDTNFGKIGVQICWDNFYPEGARILALKGAQIIFAPTAAAFASQERWRTILSANAITNNVFMFRVNRVGKEACHDFYGQSFCINPYGELEHEASGQGEGVYEVEIDLSQVKKVRKDYPYLKLRRPELYNEIAGIKMMPARKKGEDKR